MSKKPVAAVLDPNLLPCCFEGKESPVTKWHVDFEGLSQDKLYLLCSLCHCMRKTPSEEQSKG